MEVLMANKTWVFERLKHSLELLAAPPEIQLRVVPSFGYRADELYLSFDHWRMKVLGSFQSELEEEQLSGLDSLQQIFVQMDQGFWTDAAIVASAEWRHVRHLSGETLQAFGWVD
jgi:hypothetical protein